MQTTDSFAFVLFVDVMLVACRIFRCSGMFLLRYNDNLRHDPFLPLLKYIAFSLDPQNFLPKLCEESRLSILSHS